MNSGDHAQPYPAGPLDFDCQEIRLVAILPGSGTDLVECKLRTISLDALIEYEALSYVWGDPSDVEDILLDGHLFYVTINLHAALKRLRDPANFRVFWIDAICIDQTSVRERNHQVGLMRQIYSKAQRVVVWLADYCETSSSELDLSSTKEEYCKQEFTRQETIDAVEYINWLSLSFNLTDAHAALVPFEFQRRRPLIKFVNCSWWSRMWTIQEAVLPEKLSFQIGCITVSWEILGAAYRIVDRHLRYLTLLKSDQNQDEQDAEALFLFGMRVSRLVTLRDNYHQGRYMSIWNLLSESASKLSTDPRDKIFALLGLVFESGEQRPWQADYSLPTHVVYKDTMARVLEETNEITRLIRPKQEVRMVGLPSWVPDWSIQTSEAVPSSCQLFLAYLSFYKSSGETQTELQFLDASTILCVKAKHLDRISAITYYLEGWPPFFDTYFPTGNGEAYIGGNGDRRSALWRMLRADVIYPNDNSGNIRRLTAEDYTLHGSDMEPSVERFSPLTKIFPVFVTDLGYIGFGTEDMQIGDTVHVFLGASVPFVLRQTARQIDTPRENKQYEFVGHCYVQGIMDGELLENVSLEEVEWIDLM